MAFVKQRRIFTDKLMSGNQPEKGDEAVKRLFDVDPLTPL